eukprot:gnl/Chilomastix_cuspidata/3207.p1 GENE.gnl/Chilomastix_cuspidata/3207~~gnl/Chilomastix_cuspidata/3207.p1  ORF type:complete len:196 (-),score=8.61 gnl/Chilomastix_cuspidata/3207:83-670(-)
MTKQGENIPYTSLVPVDKEGWLTKEGGSWKSWKKRWFVLKDSTLYYFKSKTSGSALGTFSLRGAGVRACPEASRAHSFAIITPGRSFNISADSDADRVRWMEACHTFASHGNLLVPFCLKPTAAADIRVTTDGLDSRHCREVISLAVRALPGVKDVSINEDTGMIDVVGPEVFSGDVTDALEAAGFVAKLVSVKK